jgi:hypothetical protein
MSEVTYFVALPFVATECFNPSAVVMRAEAVSRKEGYVGAVAFSRTRRSVNSMTAAATCLFALRVPQ